MLQESREKAMEDEFPEITLRPMEISDVDDFMVWATDDRVSRFCVWDTYTSKDQALDFINNNAIPHPWLRVICVNNRAIGSISVTPPSSDNNRCRGELGYVLAFKYWGKGIATRAVKMVAATIFAEWPHLKRLEALVAVGNMASQRVLEKAGFEKEGVLRKYCMLKGKCTDLVIYSLISSNKTIEMQLQANEDHMDVDCKEVKEGDSSKITLRLLDLSDVDDFMELLTDDRVSRWCSWDTFTSKEAAMDYIANYVIPHPWYRAICLNAKPIGAISVAPRQGNDSCRGELGYVVASKYWGKGVATKAVQMVASAIFVEWPHLERLEALVDVENPGSQRVLEKVGFQREGVLRKYCLLKGKPRDMVMFSLLSSDPQINYFIHD